jgi:hypothetical protein
VETEGRKDFFSEEKKQKTFAEIKVFCFFSSEKNILAFLPRGALGIERDRA